MNLTEAFATVLSWFIGYVILTFVLAVIVLGTYGWINLIIKLLELIL